MRSIHEIGEKQRKTIRFVLTDIDDTLTRDGRLLSGAYAALWRLHNAGFRVIPVTGRPAGWCDLIARQWPVAGVVGENGAFVFYSENGKLSRMYHPTTDIETSREKLDAVRRAVLSRVEGARVAKDQFSRLFDLAIDFAEEEPRLPHESVVEIKEICEEFGAKAKISSIHVNTWFGEYDKLSMALVYLQRMWGIENEEAKDMVLYCGDSPNDVPMFRFFPLSCGMGNVRQWLHLMEWKPAYVTEKWYGDGFAETADVILGRGRS
jgi:HAD superfamily hydrolase (TIGR01484 family)